MNRSLKAKVFQVARKENRHADSLAILASSLTEEVPRLIKAELVAGPSINIGVGVSMIAMSRSCWMDPIVNFLTEDQVPNDEKEEGKVRRVTTRYWSSNRKLYQGSFGGGRIFNACIPIKLMSS